METHAWTAIANGGGATALLDLTPPGTPASPAHCAHGLAPDDLEAVVGGARFEHIQLRPVRMEGAHIRIAAAEGQLNYLRFPAAVALRGAWPPGSASIVLTLRVPDRWCAGGLPYRRGSVGYWDEGCPLDAHVPAGTEWLVLTLDRARLALQIECADPAARPDPIAAGVPLRMPPAAADKLLRRFESMSLFGPARLDGSGGVARQAFHSIADGFAAALRSARPETDSHAISLRHHRLVRRAEAHVRAHLFDNIRMRSLSRAVGASERLLEYAFRESYEMSAIAFLRAVRLNGARRSLLESDKGGVTQAAMDWGFGHLSEFAGKYRELFGELPSETLRRRNGIAPHGAGRAVLARVRPGEQHYGAWADD